MKQSFAWGGLYFAGCLAAHSAWALLMHAPFAIWTIALLSPPVVGEACGWFQGRGIPTNWPSIVYRAWVLAFLVAARSVFDAVRFYGGDAPGEDELFFALVGVIHLAECAAILMAITASRFVLGRVRSH